MGNANAFELKYGDTPEYKRWASKDMTLIVLETHTTDSLESAVKKLQKNKIPVAAFREPDLGNVVTAIAFLADERAYRLDKYPDTPDDLKQAFLRDFTKKFALASN